MRGLNGVFSAILLVSGVAVLLWVLATHPNTPLPREWNPTKRLYIADPVTFLTPYKLDAAAGDAALCKEVLAASNTSFQSMPDLDVSPSCHIRGRVSLSAVGDAQLHPVETTCAVALRTAMWMEHGLKPAAKVHLGSAIARIEHFSSYNCRPIRTTTGTGRRMSLHATAEALDVSGFVTSEGRRLSLLRDWRNEPEFFQAARDSACQWFKTTLGPEYNALHADHFHLQSRGWGTCR